MSLQGLERRGCETFKNNTQDGKKGDHIVVEGGNNKIKNSGNR